MIGAAAILIGVDTTTFTTGTTRLSLVRKRHSAITSELRRKSTAIAAIK
jgi:hypothetical protein